MKTPPPRFLTIGPLRQLCAEWQARLGLQAYVIKLTLVTCATFDDHRVIGDIDAARSKRKAWIRMLDRSDDPDFDDHETCLVHELLHLVIPIRLFPRKVDADDLGFQLYEQGIDQLARTLVALKRRG